MSSHEIMRVSADDARRFWEQQEDARIFVHPDVLGPLCHGVDWWQASWKSEPVCLWPVCHADDGSHRPPEFASYVGPLWNDTVARNKAHRWWSITKTVQQAFLEFFIDRYGQFEFELPPATRDVRVLQWFRDENASSVRMVFDCRHTALIRAAPGCVTDEVVAGFSRDRFKDVMRSTIGPPTEFLASDADQLYALYQNLLEVKSSAHVAQRRRSEFMSVLQIANAGHGNILTYRDIRGIVEAFSVSLCSRKTASLILNVAASDTGGRGYPAWLRLQNILVNSRRGATTFDFLGANSRLGADEKHRYGAWPHMYFRVSVATR